MVPDLNLTVISNNPDCTECELHECVHGLEASGQRGHVGIGTRRINNSLSPSPTTPCLLVVGQGPSIFENKAGHPFMGKVGLRLLGNEKMPGIYLDSLPFRTTATIYIADATRCLTHKNESPKDKHAKACSQHLLRDLIEIAPSSAPTYILLLGAFATRSFHSYILGTRGVSLTKAMADNGRTHDVQDLKVTTVSTFHPSVFDREANKGFAVSDHLQLLYDIMTGNSPTPSTPQIVSPRSPQ